ncbi:hypothetical protein H4V98_003849 [Polaromonas sp. CG_23.6]|nr:hypothetical protein [Polaromonas sp. CG_23.6]
MPSRPPPLLVPVQGITPRELRDTFGDGREGGHEAIDILAPTGTLVLAADDGHIARLFLSKPGGITVYPFDPSGRLAYYYAHLERYADGLAECQAVRRYGGTARQRDRLRWRHRQCQYGRAASAFRHFLARPRKAVVERRAGQPLPLPRRAPALKSACQCAFMAP